MKRDEIFKDLKVVELASVLAGPAVGMFFSELGAKITKIENKTTGGDVTRNWRLPQENKDKDWSAYYCSINYKKEVLFLNLRDKTDLQKVYALIKESDIVINNIKDSSAIKMGIDYDKLKSINPRIIYAQLYAFGKTIDRPAFDVVLQAETGYLSMSGEGIGQPHVKMPVALIDQLAAHQLKEGILVALLNRYKTGLGSFVSSSLFESSVASLANQASNWLNEGHIPQKMGTLHPNISPYGEMFKSSDGVEFLLAIGNDKQFANLWHYLNLDENNLDTLFKTNPLRVTNRVALYNQLLPALSKQKYSTLSDYFLKTNIPFGKINNMKDVFEIEAAQKMVLEEQYEDGITNKRVSTVAFSIND